MTLRLGINGYGRIGRCVLRALYERNLADAMRVVHINDPAAPESLVHLTRYDSTHGRFTAAEVLPLAGSGDGDGGGGDGRVGMSVGGDDIVITGFSDLSDDLWRSSSPDLVLECSGRYTSRSGGEAHLQCGAPRVLIGAPAGEDVDATVIWGINQDVLDSSQRIVSAASCTTNCMAHLLTPLEQHLGIEHGFYTTVHSYTNDQQLVDAPHSDLRRARAGASSIIPTTTWASQALGWVMPDLANKLTGSSVRVPVLNVSCLELNLATRRQLDVADLNALLFDYSLSCNGVLDYCDEPLVSSDFIHHAASGIVDATRTQRQGDLSRVYAWYDNEWGYANRLLDIIGFWCGRW